LRLRLRSDIFAQSIMKHAFKVASFVFCNILCFQLAAAEDHDGFRPIFNGKDLSGWDGNPKFWSVKDGVITGQTTQEKPTDHNTFLIWRDGKVDDFELHLKFRMEGGNSGIQYRSKESPDWVIGGYQADFEAGTTYSGILYEERGRGILAERGQKVVVRSDGKPQVTGSVGDSAKIQGSIKQGDWNDYVVIAHGNHLTHKINGLTTVDVTDNDEKNRAFSGLLAFQIHAGPPMLVQFKDVELKRLKLADNKKKIVLVAGRPSHPPGAHEFNAGVQLLDKCLQGQKNVLSTFYLNGWPKDPTAFDNVDAILFYMDGGANHPAIQENHIEILDALAKKGVGLGFAHYAVEVPAGKPGEAFQRWIGGYYEDHYSVNPMWTPNYTSFPSHPVANGVKPFSELDEWYFNMRWASDLTGITQILVDKPSDKVRGGPYVYPAGPYEHIKAASGRAEAMMWAKERSDGGRGFGCTGGHRHVNWGDDNFRKVVLNALVWIAKAEVPADGVESKITEEDLKQNLDPKAKK
jgi:type 1 glutamine amidotransferase